MNLDDDQDGLLSQMTYNGYLLKTIQSAVAEDAVRIIDTSGLTETKYMTTIGAPLWHRLEKSKRTGPFLWVIQLANILMVDAKLDTDP